MPTPVKICGITTLEHGLAATRLGAHALGFVFWRPSPRNIDAEAAGRIIRALPPFVTTVGLFVDAARDEVDAVLDHADLNLLQFHGDEDAEFCRSFRVPYIKAVRVRAGMSLVEYGTRYSDARALLLDAYIEGVAGGGTGTSFDWDLIPPKRPLPMVLSGGLTPGNVAEAIRRVRPDAVDVSSGVESAKGIKDAAKIAAFMQGVRDADG